VTLVFLNVPFEGLLRSDFLGSHFRTFFLRGLRGGMQIGERVLDGPQEFKLFGATGGHIGYFSKKAGRAVVLICLILSGESH